VDVFEQRLLFDRQRPRLPRLDWLNQIVPLPAVLPAENERRLSLREVIRWVCDRDGGVHVDPQPDSIPRDEQLPAWILAMGAYILDELNANLSNPGQ
jgi:hypothetical protein